VIHRELWLYVASFIVLVMAACTVHDNGSGPGKGGGSVGGAVPPAGGEARSLPSGLRAAYIAARQREAPPAYVVTPKGGGVWTARNEAHRFTADFDVHGISLAPEGAGAWRLGLSVARYGCDGRLQPVSDVAPEGAGNRITYRWVDPGAGALVEEWYANGPLGLEQGFSIEAPPCVGDGSIVLQMALDGLTASPRGEGAAVLRDDKGLAALQYTDVYAQDARGRALPARLSVEGNRLAIHIDAAEAAYPV
jgi:hypothetical protein